MRPATHGLRLARGVRWRSFTDGVVVHVAETCETHLLSPHCAAFFDNPGASAPSNSLPDGDPGRRTDTASPGLKEAPDDTLQALIDLEIFDRVN